MNVGLNVSMKVSQIVKRDLLTEKQFSAKIKVDSLKKKKKKNWKNTI
jgi:hypothetical protein